MKIKEITAIVEAQKGHELQAMVHENIIAGLKDQYEEFKKQYDEIMINIGGTYAMVTPEHALQIIKELIEKEEFELSAVKLKIREYEHAEFILLRGISIKDPKAVSELLPPIEGKNES